MTPFNILEKKFFVQFWKVKFPILFLAKQSFVEQNGGHFWHFLKKNILTCWNWTPFILDPQNPESGFLTRSVKIRENPDCGFFGSKINGVQFQQVKMFIYKKCQKWAPFCSTKLCLARNRIGNFTFQNWTKFFFF